MTAPATPLDRWLLSLEQRHLSDLTFAEVRRGLQAVSTSYVERRDRLRRSGVFDGAGKRAAYAMFYGPLHYLTTGQVVEAAGLAKRPLRHIVDLGCGTGAAGAAWAAALPRTPELQGVDRNSWAVTETRHTWRTLGLRGNVVRGNAVGTRLPGRGAGIVVGWLVNELPDDDRAALLEALCDATERGARVLILEPIARRVNPWWDTWAAAFAALGGRSDTWRFSVDLPPLLARLDRASGLNHRELKARGVST